MTAAWVEEQRDAFARRLLAADRPDEALAWLDAKSDAAPSVPQTLIASAQLAIARTAALRRASEQEQTAAIAAARAAIALAWPEDPVRRTIARVELAESAAEAPLAATVWREALASLPASTAEATRVGSASSSIAPTWPERREPAQQERWSGENYGSTVTEIGWLHVLIVYW